MRCIPSGSKWALLLGPNEEVSSLEGTGLRARFFAILPALPLLESCGTAGGLGCFNKTWGNSPLCRRSESEENDDDDDDDDDDEEEEEEEEEGGGEEVGGEEEMPRAVPNVKCRFLSKDSAGGCKRFAIVANSYGSKYGSLSSLLLFSD